MSRLLAKRTSARSEDSSSSDLSTPSQFAAKNPKVKIYLNKTFLDVHDCDFKPPEKPRTRSDPGMDCSSESMSDFSESNKFWQHELELLSGRMNGIWRNRCSDSSTAAGDMSDTSSDGAQANSEQVHFSNHWRDLQDSKGLSNTLPCPEGTVKEAVFIATSAPVALGFERLAGLTSADLATVLPFGQLNRGSIGHPELCPRPCLYFARGGCARGADCEYCHLEHSKKPSHLTKRNRETLKAARFEELLALSLPLLREKVQKLGLNPDVLQVLDDVAGRIRIRRTRALQKLGDALGSLQLRTLLTTLRRTERDHASTQHAELTTYVDRIWTLVLPNMSEGAPDYLPDQDEM
jgi:hypothetical protein